MDWKPANESKPKQGERVLLKIKYENNPVVGYWAEACWVACCVNHKVSCGQFCYGGMIGAAFEDDEVTHYAEIGELPE